MGGYENSQPQETSGKNNPGNPRKSNPGNMGKSNPGTSNPDESNLGDHEDKEGPAGNKQKQIPYYTEVVKLKKSSKSPAEGYNQLVHVPVEYSEAQPLQLPSAEQQDDYSALTSDMKGAPQVPPCMDEADPAVYYNETAAMRAKKDLISGQPPVQSALL